MSCTDQVLFSRNAEIFVDIARTRSLSRTAENFGVSISAVSRQLADFEPSLSVELFDRARRPLVLTPEGRLLHGELLSLMKSAQAALKRVEAAGSLKPSLHLGLMESFAESAAPHLIVSLSSSVRSLVCLTGGADRLVELLRDGKVDIILSINPCFENSRLRRHLLLEEPSVIIFPKRAGVGISRSWTWGELAFCGLPLIKNYFASGGGRLESRHLTTHDLNFVSKLQTDNNALCIKMVAEGAGWVIIRPLTLLAHEYLLPELQIYASPDPGVRRKAQSLCTCRREGASGPF